MAANRHDDVHAERIRQARDEACQNGLELLTPLAARTLFSKSAEAVRKAVRIGRVHVPYTLHVTDRHVSLIDLKSAIDYWGEPDSDRLDRMRDDGQMMGISELAYNVLHPTPLVTVCTNDGPMSDRLPTQAEADRRLGLDRPRRRLRRGIRRRTP